MVFTKSRKTRDFPGGPMVRVCLAKPGMWMGYLVGELKSFKLHIMVINKYINKWYSVSFHPFIHLFNRFY